MSALLLGILLVAITAYADGRMPVRFGLSDIELKGLLTSGDIIPWGFSVWSDEYWQASGLQWDSDTTGHSCGLHGYSCASAAALGGSSLEAFEGYVYRYMREGAHDVRYHGAFRAEGSE